MRVPRREPEKARIEVIPMIDIIFFLLVFFMISTLSMTINRAPETPGSLDATFGNTLVAGTWTLLIRDDAAGNAYRLDSWALRFVF